MMRRRPKSFLPVMLILMFIPLVLAGCNSAILEQTADAKSAGRDKKQQVTTLHFWFSIGGEFQRDFQKYVIEEFEKTHPGIKVKLTIAEDADKTHISDKLLAAIAGKSSPDVAVIDRFTIGSMAAKGAVEDISDLVRRDGIQAADYDPGAWEEVRYQNKVYGLPFLADTRAMYYNKTLMRNAGLNPERPPGTIEELDDMVEKLFIKNRKGKYEQVGFVPWMGQGSLFTHALNFGARFAGDNGEFDLSEPQTAQALKWMTSYAKKYDIANLSEFSDTTAQIGVSPFWTGKIGFVFEGNWILRDLEKYRPEFEWGVAPMPSVHDSPQTSWIGGNAMIIPKGAVQRELAWAFIKYAAQKDGNFRWAEHAGGTGLMTSMPAVNERLGLSQDHNMRVFLDLMSTSQIRPVSPAASFYWAETYRIRDLAINGKGAPAALLQEAKDNIGAELAKIKRQEK
ncbi:ABC transporter substrate-binding protein [Paenibacillus doosanensis]|uniref:ABC transporter substrate-binding protein n=1 Tax=Paenibacillus doosanensis TaxID=1229154 RepID=UPI0021803BC1|nr:ABC transporter substrate-binding protein [Paenibacillus doosanensis]MCS7459692.1 ABC transporter substrate-binding protein [Paenibacillus doosanensis]